MRRQDTSAHAFAAQPPVVNSTSAEKIVYALIFLLMNGWLLERATHTTDVPGFFTQALFMNALLLVALYGLSSLIIRPLKRILHHLHQVRVAFVQDQPAPRHTLYYLGNFASEISRFTVLAVEYYRRHQEISRELADAQRIVAQLALHQDTLLDSTSREIGTQYRAVLAYANYLEEQIMRNRIDPTLRYDFDEVCESSFNLKLIAGALAMLSVESPPHVTHVPLASIMQRTMFSLAPALDRRAMKLSTAEVNLDVLAHGDPGYINHIVWMMLLGMIRYAADESTLRMRCFYNHDESRALMSIVVSELAPQHMSQEERGHHLARQLAPVTPHMFAETIRIHGNVQLAHLLSERMGGSISVVPLTSTSCEICMELPSADMRMTAV